MSNETLKVIRYIVNDLWEKVGEIKEYEENED